MVYNIVCTHKFKNLVSKLENYKMDLGTSFTNRTEFAGTEQKIQDDFVMKFYNKYKNLVYKVGVLGAINFYTLPSLQDNQIYVSLNKDITLIDISDEDMENAKSDILTFIGKILHDLQA